MKNKEVVYWARQCDISGKGMNEGWCWANGVFYTATLEHTLAECRKDREHILSYADECDAIELDSIEAIKLNQAIERAKNNKDTDRDLLLIGCHLDYLYYTKWTRWQCDISGEGMNEGYCINDGGMYIKYEKDMVEWLRSKDWEFENEYGLIINVAKLDDYDLLEWALNDEIYHWIEWLEKEDIQYKEIDGKLIKLNLK
jgi:hypothetical protein